MSMLLLVRSADDVRAAVKAASEFLVYRRRRFEEPRETDEVLGIWLRRELDAGLPAWLWFDRELGARVRVDSLPGETASRLDPREAGVAILESFSLSGLWTLCWIDVTLMQHASSPAERRRRILDAVLITASASQSPCEPGTFFPVFGANDASDSIGATMRELQDHYPKLIGGTWLVDDRERGLVSAKGPVDGQGVFPCPWGPSGTAVVPVG